MPRTGPRPSVFVILLLSLLGAAPLGAQHYTGDVPSSGEYSDTWEPAPTAAPKVELDAGWSTATLPEDHRQRRADSMVKDLLAERQTLFRDHDGGYANYRLPALLALDRGTLLAFAEGRRYSRSDRGNIDLVLCRSVDGGDSWSSVTLVHEQGGSAPVTIGNPCPVYDRETGEVVLLFCRNNDRVFATRSADRGLSWSRPEEITVQVKPEGWGYYTLGPGGAVQLESGRLVFPAAHHDPRLGERGRRSHVILSDDHGRSFRLGGIVGVRTKEATLAPRDDGSLLINMRGLGSVDRREQAVSRDGGESWGEPAYVPDLIGPGCHAALLRWQDPGTSESLLLFANPASTRRQNLTLRLSRDGGRSWNAGKLLETGFSGFSSLAALGGDEIGCLFEVDRYARIDFARFRVGDVEDCPVYLELAARSYPGLTTRTSLVNPWGEDLFIAYPLPPDFGLRVATAAAVYNDQRIPFDGYMGSDDDGSHYLAATDGEDNAYLGSREINGYYLIRDGVVDGVDERSWVCLDYPIHALALAGYPIREAMIDDFRRHRSRYTHNGNFEANQPSSHWYFRRVVNLRRYLQHRHIYHEDRITTVMYRDPAFRPEVDFQVGDILFFGHQGDRDGLGPWFPKHSGIVASLDRRGLPRHVYNMRVSHRLIDEIDGLIDQTREIEGESVYFERFIDRYPIVGHGRITQGFLPASPERPVLSPEQLTAFRDRAEHGTRPLVSIAKNSGGSNEEFDDRIGP